MTNHFAWIVDAQYAAGTARRLWGPEGRFDLVELRDLACLVPYKRQILWAKVIVAANDDDEGAAARTDNFVTFLRRHNFRVEVVHKKPINRLLQRAEPNSADFAVVEAIALAARKASTIVLCAGDGHFRHAVHRAHYEAGCRVEIMGDRRSLSSDLEADHVHYLDDLAEQYDLRFKDTVSLR